VPTHVNETSQLGIDFAFWLCNMNVIIIVNILTTQMEKVDSGMCADIIKPACVVTHAGIAACVGRAFRCICLLVGVLTEKWLELSTPNLVHVYSIAVARHALTQRSKGKRLRRSHSARLLVTMAGIL